LQIKGGILGDGSITPIGGYGYFGVLSCAKSGTPQNFCAKSLTTTRNNQTPKRNYWTIPIRLKNLLGLANVKKRQYTFCWISEYQIKFGYFFGKGVWVVGGSLTQSLENSADKNHNLTEISFFKVLLLIKSSQMTNCLQAS